MFVPGAKRASAAGVNCAGAASVPLAGGVAVGAGVGVDTAPGVNVRLADLEALPTIAVIVTAVLLLTADVVTVKFADV